MSKVNKISREQGRELVKMGSITQEEHDKLVGLGKIAGVRAKTMATKFAGTDRTVYFPHLTFSKSKRGGSSDAITKPMMTMKKKWVTLATPIFNQLVQEFAENSPEPTFNFFNSEDE